MEGIGGRFEWIFGWVSWMACCSLSLDFWYSWMSRLLVSVWMALTWMVWWLFRSLELSFSLNFAFAPWLVS